MVNPAALAQLRDDLAAEAGRLGFVACGIAGAAEDPARAARLEQWLGEGLHGTMEWMATRAAHRRSPQGLWPEAQRVIALGMRGFDGRHFQPNELTGRPNLRGLRGRTFAEVPYILPPLLSCTLGE